MNTHEVAFRKGEGRSIWLLGDLHTFKLTGEALSVTELTAGQGAFVHIPKGMLHTYKNTGSTPGRMIVLLTPGGFERLWEELGEEPATQLTTRPPVDAGMIEKLIALAPTYHLQIPPPPG